MDDLLLHIFCLVDDGIKALNLGRLRRRGPQPHLADSEVITMELAGELIGLDQDQAIYRHFKTHYLSLFPSLRQVDRTNFLRQAANLWRVQQRLHRQLVQRLVGNEQEALWIIDSFPLPVCRFARAPSCKRLADVANFGKDHGDNRTYYGLRVHVRCTTSGVIGGFELAAANIHDTDLAGERLPVGSVSLGDRNSWDPLFQSPLREDGTILPAPFKRKSSDPWPGFSRTLSRVRQIIEPVIGQLAERLHAKRTWAKDLWHLCSRMIRKVLAHTIATTITRQLGYPPLQFERLFDE